MTFPRYGALLRGWRRSPPTHVLLRIFMGATVGYKPPAETDPEPAPAREGQENEQSLEDLMQAFTAAGGVVS